MKHSTVFDYEIPLPQQATVPPSEHSVCVCARVYCKRPQFPDRNILKFLLVKLNFQYSMVGKFHNSMIMTFFCLQCSKTAASQSDVFRLLSASMRTRL